MGKKDELIQKHNINLKSNILNIDKDVIVIRGYKLKNIIENGANAIIIKANGEIAKEPVAIKI